MSKEKQKTKKELNKLELLAMIQVQSLISLIIIIFLLAYISFGWWSILITFVAAFFIDKMINKERKKTIYLTEEELN